MTDIFPAVAAIYPPDYAETLQKPYETVGTSDSGYKPYVECRVILHNSNLFVGIDGPRGPQFLFKGTYVNENVFQDRYLTRVLTDDGHLVVFGTSKGCGCGSRLRTWNPYGTVLRSSRG